MQIKYLEDFIEAAIQEGDAKEEGYARIANKNYSKINRIVKKWNDDPQMDLKLLELLLEHENDSVKLNVAFLLLPILPEKAEKALEKVSLRDKSNLGFEAEWILSDWKKGMLKF